MCLNNQKRTKRKRNEPENVTKTISRIRTRKDRTGSDIIISSGRTRAARSAQIPKPKIEKELKIGRTLARDFEKIKRVGLPLGERKGALSFAQPPFFQSTPFRNVGTPLY